MPPRAERHRARPEKKGGEGNYGTIMSENDIRLVTSVPADVSKAQAKAASVPQTAAPSIPPERLKSQADSVKAATVDTLNANHADFKKAVVEINRALEKIPTTLAFQVDASSNRFVVNVADMSTGELLRQIPGDAVLRIARQLESLKGIIFDDKY